MPVFHLLLGKKRSGPFLATLRAQLFAILFPRKRVLTPLFSRQTHRAWSTAAENGFHRTHRHTHTHPARQTHRAWSAAAENGFHRQRMRPAKCRDKRAASSFVPLLECSWIVQSKSVRVHGVTHSSTPEDGKVRFARDHHDNDGDA